MNLLSKTEKVTKSQKTVFNSLMLCFKTLDEKKV